MMDAKGSLATVVEHYTKRHTFRGDLFGEQPFANYGYWTRPGLSLEEAAETLTVFVGAAAGLSAHDAVLDVGCGYGAGAVCWNRRLGVQNLVGLDATPIRIESGTEYVAKAGLSQAINLRLGSATQMPFDQGEFDKVVSVESAFHFETRLDFLAEAARVLRPGGTLALTDMIPKAEANPEDYIQGLRTREGGVNLDMPVNAYPATEYSAKLQACGFTAIRIESIVEWTRKPFIKALRSLAENSQGERAQTLANMALRLQAHVDAGEDYVLVVARKKEADCV